MAAIRLKQEVKNLKATELATRQTTHQSNAQTSYILDQREQMTEMIKLLKLKMPGAQAEAEFWQRLNSGDLGSSAKGLQQFLPLLKIISGK